MANQQIGVEVVAVGIAAFSRAMRTAQDDLERTSNSINKAAGITQSFGKTLTNLGGNMQRVGRAMLIDVTAPLGILTGVLINAGVQFEDAFAGIGKTVGGVSVGFQEIKDAAQRELGITITTMDEARQAAEQMGMAFGDLTAVGMEVRNEFRQMALDIPMSATELAELGEIVGQLGIEAPQIGEVTKQVAELGLTTNMSAEDAAMSLIRMANIMRTTVGPDAITMTEFIKRAGSALVDLGNKSVATESEIMNFALRLSAAGDMANFSEQQVLAWATTLADLGARAESGGTAVSRALENMIIAVQSGSKELDLFASVAGMSGAEFTKIFREDASAALGMFTQKLKEAFEAGKIKTDMLTAMGLGGIRAFDILGRLGNAQEILAKNTANANKAWEQAVALEEEAEKRFGTFKNQLQILKNTFTDLGISIFDLVEGDLKVLVEWLKGAINWFKGLDDGIKKNVVIFAAIAAVIGPLLIVFGGLISLLGAATTAITALGSVALPVIGILAALGATVGALSGIDLFKGIKPPKIPGATTSTDTTTTSTEAIDDQTQSTEEATQAVQDYTLEWRRVKVPIYVDKVNESLTAATQSSHALNAEIAALGNAPPIKFEYQWVQVKVPKTQISETKTAQETPAPNAPGITSPVMNWTPLQKSWEELKESIQTDIGEIGKSLGSLNIPDVIKESGVLDTLSEWKSKIEGLGVDFLAKTFDDIKVAANSFTTHFSSFIEQQGPNIEEFFAAIDTLLKSIEPLLESLAPLLGQMSEAAPEDVGEALAVIAGMTFQGIIDALTTLVKIITWVVEAITWWNNTIAQAGRTLGQLAVIVKFIATDIESKFSQALTNAILGISIFVLNTIAKFNELKTDVLSTISGLISGIAKFFTDLWNNLVGNSIVVDIMEDVLTVFSDLKDRGLQIITDFVAGIASIFANIKLPSLGSLVGGLTGGTSPAAGGEESGQPEQAAAGGAAPINIQQIAALQQAILALQDVWTGFSAVVTTTLTNISQTFMLLTQFTSSIFSNMAISFVSLFIGPITQAIIEFATSAFPLFTILSDEWRVICLGMVKSWLDFTANAAKLTPGFVDGVIGEFKRLRDNTSGQISLITSQFVEDFGAGGDAPLAIEQFGAQLMGLEPKFSKLVSAVNKFIGQVNSKLKSICPAMAVAIACITGSPELKLQHPFELFEDYLKGVDYGKLITKATVMPQLENVMSVIPNTQGSITNIDRSISSTITGLPIDTAENVADTMLRTIRMGEVLQG